MTNLSCENLVHFCASSPPGYHLSVTDSSVHLKPCPMSDRRYVARGAAHCISLHCTALYCTALNCTELHCTALHCTALHCTALLCPGACMQASRAFRIHISGCSTAQCAAIHQCRNMQQALGVGNLYLLSLYHSIQVTLCEKINLQLKFPHHVRWG